MESNGWVMFNGDIYWPMFRENDDPLEKYGPVMGETYGRKNGPWGIIGMALWMRET